MGLVKTMYEMRKIQKHMKKSRRLQQHMNQWLEDEFKTKDEQKLLDYLQCHPSEMEKIVKHYKEIKGDY